MQRVQEDLSELKGIMINNIGNNSFHLLLCNFTLYFTLLEEFTI